MKKILLVLIISISFSFKKNEKEEVLINLIYLDFKKYDINHFPKGCGDQNILQSKLSIWTPRDIKYIQKIFPDDSIDFSATMEANNINIKLKQLKNNKKGDKQVKVEYTYPISFGGNNIYFFIKRKEISCLGEKIILESLLMYLILENGEIINVSDGLLKQFVSWEKD